MRPAKQVWLMFIFAAWSFFVSSCSNHPNVIKRRKQVLFRLQQGLRYEEGGLGGERVHKKKLRIFWAAGELSRWAGGQQVWDMKRWRGGLCGEVGNILSSRWVGEQQVWVMKLKASLGSLPSMPSMPALHRFYQRLRLLSQFADRSKYLNEQQDPWSFLIFPP